MIILNNTISFNSYLNESGKLQLLEDLTSVQLPSVENGSDTLSGSGLMGPIDMPSMFNVAAMSCDLNFRHINAGSTKLMSPGEKTLIFKWAVDKFEKGVNDFVVNTATVKGNMKKTDFGKIESQAKADGAMSFEITYYKLVLNNVVVLELDKLNQIYVVNGVDYMEKLRSAL